MIGMLQVVVHVMGSFQVYSMPVFDMIETQLVKNGISNGLLCRLIYRSIYVVIVAFVGITLPFFGDLLGFIGKPILLVSCSGVPLPGEAGKFLRCWHLTQSQSRRVMGCDSNHHPPTGVNHVWSLSNACLMQVLLPLVPQHSGEHSSAQHQTYLCPPLLDLALTCQYLDCKFVAGFPP